MLKGHVSLCVTLSSSTDLQDRILPCLLHSLGIHVYQYGSQKIISRKFIFQRLSGPLLENSWKIFLWSRHSSPLAEQERLRLARTRIGLPKRTNTTCDLLRVTQVLARPPASQVIHHRHHQRLPGCQRWPPSWLPDLPCAMRELCPSHTTTVSCSTN